MAVTTLYGGDKALVGLLYTIRSTIQIPGNIETLGTLEDITHAVDETINTPGHIACNFFFSSMGRCGALLLVVVPETYGSIDTKNY